MITQPIALCLACSSSPSPKVESSPFTTPCCARPICERCLANKPRLRGYNPCLACLAGVAVVDQARILGGKGGKVNVRVTIPGPSGQSQDQEESMFVLGDSDEEADEPQVDVDIKDAPPPYSGASETSSTAADDETLVGDTVREVMPEAKGPSPSQYYVQRGDTLRGIALRYGVDGRKICQLNSLPFSTLSTTPHLLHTRRYLTLPPTSRPILPPPDPHVLEAHKRERAEKRFQFVTKEVDWRVAKAYVALAEDEDDSAKTKEDLENLKTQASGSRALEASAVDQYLDDGEWEARQSDGPRLQGFPPFAADGKDKDKTPEKVTLSSRLGKLIHP